MKKNVQLKFCFLLLVLAFGHPATAQFWKSNSKTRKVNSSNKYPIKPIQKAEPKVEKKPVEKKKRTLDLAQSKQKDRYRIDILIPLYLDELPTDSSVKVKMPEKAQAGVNFYEGIKIAVDTLNGMGYKTDIYVHDITANGAQIDEFIKNDSLKNTDLIIGFVSNLDIVSLADYAQSKKVNFISAFSPSDANISNNPYFFLLNPTLENNCIALVESLLKKQKNQSVFLFKRETISVDSLAYHYIVDDSIINNTITVDCNKMPDSLSLSSLFDSTAKNIIMMPIMDAYYAEKIIQNLKNYFPNYQFQIYGMPTWKGITNNRKMIELGTQISIIITQPYNFDLTNTMGQYVANKYKSTFGGVPNELTYRGFELTYWLTDLINKYGTIFNEKTTDRLMAPFTQYELKPKWDKANKFYYFENKHLYLFQYQAGTVIVN